MIFLHGSTSKVSILRISEQWNFFQLSKSSSRGLQNLEDTGPRQRQSNEYLIEFWNEKFSWATRAKLSHRVIFSKNHFTLSMGKLLINRMDNNRDKHFHFSSNFSLSLIILPPAVTVGMKTNYITLQICRDFYITTARTQKWSNITIFSILGYINISNGYFLQNLCIYGIILQIFSYVKNYILMLLLKFIN